MTEAEQVAIHDRLVNRASLAGVGFWLPNEAEIRRRARTRLIAGVPQFGARGWRATPADLWNDMVEECADHLNYNVFLLHQQGY